MKKRRLTVSLDEDVVESLESLGDRSLSAAVNRALRQTAAAQAHRTALVSWLDELDSAQGAATAAEAEGVAAFLDEILLTSSDADSAA